MKRHFHTFLSQIKAFVFAALNTISKQLNKFKRHKNSNADSDIDLDLNSKRTAEDTNSPSLFSKAKNFTSSISLTDKKEELFKKSNELNKKVKQTIENKEDISSSFKAKSERLLNSTKAISEKVKDTIQETGKTALSENNKTNTGKISEAKDSIHSKFDKVTGALGQEALHKSKDKLSHASSELKDKFKNLKSNDGILGKESLTKSTEKFKNLSSSLKDKLVRFKESDSSVLKTIKSIPIVLLALVGRISDSTKKTIQHIKNADVSGIGKATSPIFTKWSQFSLKVASVPWINGMIDKWMSLKIWSKEKLFYRYTMPTLVGVCAIFLILTTSLFFITRSNISSLKNEFGADLVESKRQEKIQKYSEHVSERSDEIEQILRDNVNKTSLIAESPTFQELNIQGMEEFSRSLLQKDTNLLNVVVLTHEEVKANIRTRRIGEETEFIFSCCELNEDRAINYDEVAEVEWLSEIDSMHKIVTDVYRNPVNNERFFYHGSNIKDFKGTQNGAVLLRYNLNFAVRNLQKSNITGVNFLVTNDSTVIASSQDSIFPTIKTLSMTDAASSGPVDYFSRIASIMNKAKTPEQAISQLTDAKFIGDPVRFERKFGTVMPGTIAIEPTLDSLGEGTWLTVEQAEAILDLKFGQILKLNNIGTEGNFTPEEMEMITGRVLASAYLDSIKTVGNGYIIDENYLLTFSTNEFGWTLINQSTSDEFYGDIYKAEQDMIAHFGGLNRSVLLTFLLTTLLSVCLFSLLITGFMKRFTAPIKEILNEVSVNPAEMQSAVSWGTEMEVIGQRFRSMNKEIDSYVSQLEQSNTELEQYAHVVSHDLRAPLRTISSFTQLLQQKLDKGETGEKAKSYMSFIQKGADQMEDMIRGMLSYATLKRKLSTDHYFEIDLNIQLQNALDNLKEKIEKTNPKITVSDLPVVRFKGENVVSVFQNLIDNAIKYNNPNRKEIEIDINAKHVGENYIVSVKDNGIGIDRKSRNMVFDMFYRSGDQAESIGIGLATCKAIMDNGGGKIWIDNEEDQKNGTTFLISFPNGVKQKSVDTQEESAT